MLSKVYIEIIYIIFINKLIKYKINIFYFFRFYWICIKSRLKLKKLVRIYVLFWCYFVDSIRLKLDDKGNDNFYGWYYEKLVF